MVGVRDGGRSLPSTLSSILEQRGIELELVVVDDDSRDETASQLAESARRDPRVVVVRQEASGLTAALARGCEVARAPLIARQDAGDLSHPDRLARQKELFDRSPVLALASCWTIRLGPERELLGIERGPLRDGVPAPPLKGPEPLRALGPTSHGSAMFRREAYFRAGGYRREFALGQDWDLWLRLRQKGDFAVVAAPLYARILSLNSLSFAHHALQVEFGLLAAAAARKRSRSLDDSAEVERAEELSRRFARARRGDDRRAQALGAYHVGQLLRARGDARCRHYFETALRFRPLFLRAWVRLLQSGRLLAPPPADGEEPELEWAGAR